MKTAGLAAQQQISQQDYEVIRDFLEQACGIVLGDNKHYLVSSRLGRLLKEHGLTSLGELVTLLKRRGDPRLQARVIDAMTTNETSWFRDGYPFEILKNTILPALASQGVRNARIWSAACSSGQEPFSISMVIHEFLRGRPGALPGIQVIATDISPTVLKGAQEGLFDELSLSRGLSPELRKRYFEATDGLWRINAAIRERVVFKEINLLQSFAALGKFDCIFCRNVLIYFSGEVKKDILARMTGALRPGGYLFLGGSESFAASGENFDTVRCTRGHVYRLKMEGKDIR